MPSYLHQMLSQALTFSFSELKANRKLLIEVQSRLHALQLYPYHSGDPDGFYGPRTQSALQRFCEKVHLNSMETGLFGPSFAQALLETKPPERPSLYTLPHWWQGGTKEELAQAISQEGKKQGIRERNQLCYIMATIQHETAHTYRPIAEYGGKTTRYAPYYGRGYVQLTWKANYQKYSDLLGRDFVRYPDQVMEPPVSLFIIVHGMIYGVFTGKKLGDYIQGQRCDFVNARRIINGMDRAGLVAGYAQDWQKSRFLA